jgi:hypothetical protein
VDDGVQPVVAHGATHQMPLIDRQEGCGRETASLKSGRRPSEDHVDSPDRKLSPCPRFASPPTKRQRTSGAWSELVKDTQPPASSVLGQEDDRSSQEDDRLASKAADASMLHRRQLSAEVNLSGQEVTTSVETAAPSKANDGVMLRHVKKTGPDNAVNGEDDLADVHTTHDGEAAMTTGLDDLELDDEM